MMTITFMIGDVAMCEGYSITEFVTDEHGLMMLRAFIEDLDYHQNEYIVLIDGVPYQWNLYCVFDGGAQ